MTFGQWLLSRADDGTPVGDFASDFAATNGAAGDCGVLDVALLLRKLCVCSAVVDVFDQAVAEFRSTRGVSA